MTQSGGGFFSGEQQIFSSVILCFFSFPKCHEASVTLLSDVAVCKVVPRTVQGNHTRVSADTPGTNSNRSCEMMTTGKTRGREQARHLPGQHKSSTQQELSCIEFHTGEERTDLVTHIYIYI